jgi:hypothetical protein
MQELGRAIVPISVPFGFHNRFFSTRELGFSSGTDEGGGGAGAGGGDEQETAHQRQLRRKQPHTGGPFFGNMDRRGFWSGRVTSTTGRRGKERHGIFQLWIILIYLLTLLYL